MRELTRLNTQFVLASELGKKHNLTVMNILLSNVYFSDNYMFFKHEMRHGILFFGRMCLREVWQLEQIVVMISQ